MANAPGHHETIYLCERKGSASHELVRIVITEADDWRAAQYHLHEQLRHSMRPDLPRGAGKLAAVGDVNYSGQEPVGTSVASLVFSLGNVTIAISSVGDKTVDVAPSHYSSTIPSANHPPRKSSRPARPSACRELRSR